MYPTGWTIRTQTYPRRINSLTITQRASFGGGIIQVDTPSPKNLTTYYERRRTTNDQRWTWDHRATSPITLLGPDTDIGSGLPFPSFRYVFGTWYDYQWHRSRRRAASDVAIRARGFWPLPVMTTPEDTEIQLPIERKAISLDGISQQWAKRRDAFRRTLGFTVPVCMAVKPTSFYAFDRCELGSQLQRHLLEDTIDGGQTWNSGLWTAEEVEEFITLRVNRFQLEAHLYVVRETLSVTANLDTYFPGPQVLEILRVSYIPNAGSEIVLDRIDSHAADNSYQLWQATSGSPVAYTQTPSVEQGIQLVPTPLTAGTLTIDYVPRADDPTTTCEPLPIPAQFAWAVKWGVIADLLSQEGEANDPVRAQKAEDLFNLGVQLAKLSLTAVK